MYNCISMYRIPDKDSVYKIKYPGTKSDITVKFEELLNEEQLEVVTSDLGPSICIAGAGSGKTRVITYRVAYLLSKMNLRGKVVLLTFTNKAAKEMLSRVGQIVSNYHSFVVGGTFHHIAVAYLRKFAEVLGFKKEFTILDNEDSQELIELTLDELSLKRDSFIQASVLLDLYGLMINTLKSAEDIILEKRPYLLKYADEITRVFIRYNHKKETLSLMDFDDILKFFFILLSQHKEVKKSITEEISYVLVDEFQDTSPIQAEIAYLLASETNNIMVVGDDAQSIYSFRGACVDNMLNFPKRYKDCKIFNLKFNYRSTENILSIAQDIISSNKEQFKKELKPIRREGDKPWLVSAEDSEEEARFISSRIAELINDGHKPSEIAVLYRAHSHSMELQMELSKANIPFVIRSGLRFFEQAHLKDLTAFLRILYNTDDEISFRRLVKMFSGIGNSAAKTLRDKFLASKMDIFEWIKSVKDPPSGKAKIGFEEFKRIMIGVEKLRDERPSEILGLFVKEFYSDFLKRHYPDAVERLIDVEFFVDFVSRYNNLSELFSELSLISNLEVERGKGAEKSIDDYVVLSTVHQAKGLEFKSVFIMGLAEGMFPSQYSMSKDRELEEERRLFYVAITRAKDHLYLSYPNSVIRQDSNLFIKRRSRFLDEIRDIDKKVKLISIEYEE
ncbi:MAG: ATP-dependent helicase [Deltaproteobacteria bacterium]|nr:ATP-dependent helicase [Deltaproteobacteria bacterium]